LELEKTASQSKKLTEVGLQRNVRMLLALHNEVVICQGLGKREFGKNEEFY